VKKRTIRWRIGPTLCAVALLLFGGGTVTLTTGCDTEIATTMLGGLEDLSYTLLDAVFLSIENQIEESDTTSSTVTVTTDTTDTTS